MQKNKLVIIMALKKGVVEMKKMIFVIAVIIAITFLVIWGFETKKMQIESIEESQKEMEVITEDVKDFAEVEIEQEQQENAKETTTETESVISQEEIKKSEVDEKPKQKPKSENKPSTYVSEQSKTEEQNETQRNETEISQEVEKVEDNQEIIENKSEDEITEEIVEEEQPKVDDEYERLMAQVEYATYDECMKAGFDIAFSDTVNILGFDPIEIIYKGQVLGYKLKIHYTNPMEN